jgi:hypothetical protein
MPLIQTLSQEIRARVLLLAIAFYGLANAVLYSSLLPLWEGYDEAFHYGYVQELSTRASVPELGRSVLSNEVDRSLRMAPLSHIVRRGIPEGTTFGEYFSLAPEKRAERRLALLALDPSLRLEQSPRNNYEAHHAPLAYALLAAPDRLWSDSPLPVRVWRLRLLASCASVLLAAASCALLANAMSLGKLGTASLTFLVLSTQTYYATAAHVANDWLAVPLAFLLFAAAARLNADPTRWNALVMGIVLGLGLLTKAYFLAFVPLAFGICARRLLRSPRLDPRGAALLAFAALLSAGPWYARNLALNGTVSGMVEAASGLGPAEALSAVPDVDWVGSAAFLARGSLWTGNNHFSTFSRGTLNLMLCLLAVGAVGYLARVRQRGVSPEEAAVVAGILLYGLALAYATALSYVFTQGAAAGASMWYAQVLLAPALCVFLRGAFHLRRLGKMVLVAALLLWTYVLCATYLVKLIPLYGGYERRGNVGPLLEWYRSAFAADVDPLAYSALGSPATIYMLTFLAVSGALCLCLALVRLLAMERPEADNGVSLR